MTKVYLFSKIYDIKLRLNKINIDNKNKEAFMIEDTSMIEDTPKNGDSAGHEQISQNNTKGYFWTPKDVVIFSFGILGSLLLLLIVGVVSVAGSLFFVGSMLNEPIKSQISSFEANIDEKVNSLERKIDDMAEQNKEFQENMTEQNKEFQENMAQQNKEFQEKMVALIKTRSN